MSTVKTTSISALDNRALNLYTDYPPIQDLPPELLVHIFTYCISNDPLSPITLGQVCCHWKQLLEITPSLWQSIVLDDSDPRFSSRHAQLWIERSRPFKYDVELNVDDPDYILPLLSPLLPTIDRWRRFQHIGKRNEGAFDVDVTADSLTHLHLFLHDNEQDDIDEEESRVMFFPISPTNPNIALNIWVPKVPPPSLLPPLRFVHVTIAEGGLTGLHTQPKYVLDFLTACPELESFYMSGFTHDGPVVGPLPLVSLPNLVTLHLKSTCFARAILSSLVTPRVENLYFTLLNVDFNLYDQGNDEGDSEDEAHDYSQSPSSDRATGMGLRKFITRCNPPIRILEMDFCDMRTKDFIWVFDRLPLLEDFYIVGSDMSNNVINLLRPIPFQTPDGFRFRLRLPRLRRLRLINCQRLSGDAIVEALVQRVSWTDKMEITLTDVTISGCEGFSQSDRDALSAVLHGRLKL